MASIFAFPNPVNEYAARVTAAIVVLLSVVTLATSQGWLLCLIAIGFWLRVAGGPRYSPAGMLSVKVLTPRLGKIKMVPGPPKRFAQGIGAVLSTAAVICYFTGAPTIAWILLGALVIAASLEAFVRFCLGCAIFGILQRHGLIPADVCAACNNVTLRNPVSEPVR